MGHPIPCEDHEMWASQPSLHASESRHPLTSREADRVALVQLSPFVDRRERYGRDRVAMDRDTKRSGTAQAHVRKPGTWVTRFRARTMRCGPASPRIPLPKTCPGDLP